MVLCLIFFLILDQEFQTMQQDFLEKYYTEFEDTEENKFIYTDIHKEYVSMIKVFLCIKYITDKF